MLLLLVVSTSTLRTRHQPNKSQGKFSLKGLSGTGRRIPSDLLVPSDTTVGGEHVATCQLAPLLNSPCVTPLSARGLGFTGDALIRSRSLTINCLTGAKSPTRAHVFSRHGRPQSFLFTSTCSCCVASPRGTRCCGAGVPCAGIVCAAVKKDRDGGRQLGNALAVGFNPGVGMNNSLSCVCDHKCCGGGNGGLLDCHLFNDCGSSHCRTRTCLDGFGFVGCRGKNLTGSSIVAGPSRCFTNREGRSSPGTFGAHCPIGT